MDDELDFEQIELVALRDRVDELEASLAEAKDIIDNLYKFIELIFKLNPSARNKMMSRGERKYRKKK